MQKFTFSLIISLLGSLSAGAAGFIDRGPASGWVDQGIGEYYDGLVCDVFPELEAGQHWKVQVQNNPSNPGWYRFVPFSGEWPGVDIAGESQVYMIINASDPDKVYMCDTDKILNISGWQYIFSQNVPENLESGSMYGTLKDGVVSFPASSFVFYKCSPAGSYDLTQKENVNRTGSLKIVLPSKAAVDRIEADHAEDGRVEYYNLCGCRVENPAHGIYIKKSPSGTERVLIR